MLVNIQGAHELGKLVKIAQSVENEVSTLRVQAEPKLRSKFKEAHAEWLELKSRTPSSSISKWELRSKTFLIRTEAHSRAKLVGVIDRTVVELEKVRDKLLQDPGR